VNRSVQLVLALTLAAGCAAEKVKSLKEAEAEASHGAAAPASARPAPDAAAPAPTPAPVAPKPAAAAPVNRPAAAPTTAPETLAAPMPARYAAVPTTVPAPAAVSAAPSTPIAALTLPSDGKAGVTIALRFRTGSVDDPEGKAGLTELAAQTMAEGGTSSLDAKALLEALFPIAASIEVRVDREETTFTARVHRAAVDKLLPILSDVLLHPRWEEKEFARIRESMVSDISQALRQARDEDLAKEALAELMYRGHPYGHLIEGHISDLNSITLEEAKAHAARVFTLDRLTIGVAGGYSKELPDRLQRAFAALPATGAPAPVLPVILSGQRHPRVLLVEKPTASTAISIGMPWSLSHSDPDWAALSVARSAFGEHRQFNGRLMQRLREARGLNYGDYAYIEYFKQEGGDSATAQTGRARHQQDFTLWLRPVQNENRLFALREALYELHRSLDEEPFTEEEVARTKGFLDGYILLFDQTDSRKLGYALDGDFYGEKDFLIAWRKALETVTAAQVNAAWKKWVNPDNLQIVMAGPDMNALKADILGNTSSPIHYANGATKPQAILDMDTNIQTYPLGIDLERDIEVVPVEQLFR